MGFKNYLKYLLIFIVIGVIGVSIYFTLRNRPESEEQLSGGETVQEKSTELSEEQGPEIVSEAEGATEDDIVPEEKMPEEEIIDKDPGYYITGMQDHTDYSLIIPEGWEVFSGDEGERLTIRNTDDKNPKTLLIISEKKYDIDEDIPNGLFSSYADNAAQVEETEVFYDEYIEISGGFYRLSGYSYTSRLGEGTQSCIDYFCSIDKEDSTYIFKYIAGTTERIEARKDLVDILSTFEFEDEGEPLKLESESPSVNILILGDDSAYDRAGGRVSGRTDIIMVFHLNLETREGTIVTIPRDTWVEIPGHGEGKINGAHAIGGNELTVETIEKFSGLEIDNYMITDFDGFVPLIDFLGGVTVEVTEDLADGFSGCYLSAGIHHLNGDQALALCRNRHREGGAYARENEAAKVILALNEQKTDLQKVLALPLYANLLLNYTWTDMTVKDLLVILPALGKIDSSDIVVTSIPSWPQMVGNASAVVYDEEATADLFEQVKNQ